MGSEIEKQYAITHVIDLCIFGFSYASFKDYWVIQQLFQSFDINTHLC